MDQHSHIDAQSCSDRHSFWSMSDFVWKDPEKAH